MAKSKVSKSSRKNDSDDESEKSQVPPPPKLPPYAYQTMGHTFKIAVKKELLRWLSTVDAPKLMENVFNQVAAMSEEKRIELFNSESKPSRRRPSQSKDKGDKDKPNADRPVKNRTAYQLWGPTVDAKWIEEHYPKISKRFSDKEITLGKAKGEIWEKIKAEETKKLAGAIEQDKKRYAEEMELFEKGQFKREKRGRGTVSAAPSRAASPVRKEESERDKSPVRKSALKKPEEKKSATPKRPVAEKKDAAPSKKSSKPSSKKSKKKDSSSSSSSSSKKSSSEDSGVEQSQEQSGWEGTEAD